MRACVCARHTDVNGLVYKLGMKIKTSYEHFPRDTQFRGNTVHSAWWEASDFVYLQRRERERAACVEKFIMRGRAALDGY